MEVFRYRGRIPASKSLMNRALIAKSYESRLKLMGSSTCDDVIHLQKSLQNFPRKKVLDCGEGGTTLRFLAFRVSREPGEFFLKGTPRLLKRPQKEISSILANFGVEVRYETNGIRILSEGWKKPAKTLKLSAAESSQFLSALFLNAWGLDFDLKIQIQGKVTSESYFTMTLNVLKDLGLCYSKKGQTYLIPRNQKVRTGKYQVESDISSLFSVAGFAAISGKAEFTEFPNKSLQPDVAFLKIFKKMGVKITKTSGRLQVQSPKTLKAVDVNLQDSPDLFPVLSVVCSFCSGKSRLHGAPQLAFKESDRIAKTAELLKKAGIPCKPLPDGLEIEGQPIHAPTKKFQFDPDKDHRLAMAAAILKYFGQPLKIQEPQVVKKSFPEYWKDVGVRP